MKKLLISLLALALAIVFTACQAAPNSSVLSSPAPSESSQFSSAVGESAASSQLEEPSEAPAGSAALEGSSETGENGGVLIAYFSWAENAALEEGVDAMTSPSVSDPGNVQQLAGWIQEETGGELFDRLAPLGAECLSRTLALFWGGERPAGHPQDHAAATLAPMLDKAMGEMDFSLPARRLHDLVRGLNPWPSAWTAAEGKRLKVHRARVLREEGVEAPPGTVLPGEGLAVACGSGVLELLEVQPEGKGRMPGSAFLLGHPVRQFGP